MEGVGGETGTDLGVVVQDGEAHAFFELLSLLVSYVSHVTGTMQHGTRKQGALQILVKSFLNPKEEALAPGVRFFSSFRAFAERWMLPHGTITTIHTRAYWAHKDMEHALNLAKRWLRMWTPCDKPGVHVARWQADTRQSPRLFQRRVSGQEGFCSSFR